MIRGMNRAIQCRDAEMRDIPAITDIYNQAVLRTTGTFDTEPKTEAERADWLGAIGARECVLVSVDDGRDDAKVTGWAWLHLWSPKRAYESTGEVTLYVDEARRGGGIGTVLLRELVGRAARLDYRNLLARIAEGNDASLRLHERAGFETVGVMREVGFKFDRRLDVHLLQKRVAAS